MRAWLAVAPFILAACRPGPVKPPDTSTLPPPEQALSELRKGGEARKSLKAEGRVTYMGEKGRVRVRAVLLASRPGSFRIETISPFEQPIDVMACDGKRLWLLSQDKLREGPATPENIARLLPLPLYPEEVVDTLLGGAPSEDRWKATGITARDDGRWQLALEGAGGRATLTMDPVKKVVVELQLLEENGAPRVIVRFDDFEVPAGASDAREMAQEIVLEVPGRDMDVTIKLTQAQVDGAIADSLFRLQPPPGVPVEPLDSPAVPLPPASTPTSQR